MLNPESANSSDFTFFFFLKKLNFRFSHLHNSIASNHERAGVVSVSLTFTTMSEVYTTRNISHSPLQPVTKPNSHYV